jgi:hypothetical protein
MNGLQISDFVNDGVDNAIRPSEYGYHHGPTLATE